MTFTCDALNRLATVSEANTGTTSYAYDDVGNLASVTYPNGVVHAYTYDVRNRLTSLGVTGNSSTPGQPAVPGTIAGYAYTLDASGHRTSVAEASGRALRRRERQRRQGDRGSNEADRHENLHH